MKKLPFLFLMILLVVPVAAFASLDRTIIDPISLDSYLASLEDMPLIKQAYVVDDVVSITAQEEGSLLGFFEISVPTMITGTVSGGGVISTRVERPFWTLGVFETSNVEDWRQKIQESLQAQTVPKEYVDNLYYLAAHFASIISFIAPDVVAG